MDKGLFEGILTPEILLLNPKHGRELKDLSERNKSKTTDEIDELIRKEVLKCGKTLWISGSDEVLSEYEYLLRNYPRNRWKKSRDMLTPISSRLMFERLDKSSVPKHFQSLIETGIWRRLEEEKRARDLSLRVKSLKPKVDGAEPVTMDGSILTLFIMWSVVLSLAVVF